jgi:hypothetical protein
MGAAAIAFLLAAPLGGCSSDSKSDSSATEGGVVAIPPPSNDGGPDVGTPADALLSDAPGPAQAPSEQPPSEPPSGKDALAAALGGQAAAPANPGETFFAGDAGRLRSELDQIKARVAGREASLQKIQSGVAQDASAYEAATGGVKAGLQSGTRPPALLGQWTDAQAALDRMDADMAQLVALSIQSAEDASIASYIADSAERARALDESAPERELLGAIQADAVAAESASRTQKAAIGAAIERQAADTTQQRAGLMQLASAIEGGPLYPASAKSRDAVRRVAAAAPASPPGDLVGKKPLVVIRFDQPNVQYDAPVKKVVAEALQRKPSAIFDVVASASDRQQSNADAQGVLRALVSAGVPSNQLTLTIATPNAGSPSEVRIFVR